MIVSPVPCRLLKTMQTGLPVSTVRPGRGQMRPSGGSTANGTIVNP